MEGLTGLKEHKVGDINYVIDGLKADRHEPFLQPLRAGSHFDTLYGDAGVAWGAIGRKYLYGDGLSLPFPECIHGREGKLSLHSLAEKVCVKVPGYADVGSGVYAVCGDFILYHGFILEAQVFLCRNADGGVFRKDHDAVMAGANSKFILCAYHSKALHAANLGLLDLEVSGEDGAKAGKENLLAGSHVGSAANYGKGLRGAVVHSGNMEVVTVRVSFTGKDLSHHNAFEAAFNHFLGFNAVYLYAY